ncbi:hypothetical protein [Enterococcus sp. AZ192]|uniref:hypothetical protein n=1 Tax=unclassified Enterococcus TaxID=2608891 RepID=UPI003D267B58
MTEKTILRQIRSLAQTAVNADDDQEQFSNLMRIIELTEVDNQNFAVGEYYSYKSLENVLHILKIDAVMGDIVEAGFLNTETGKLINTRIELDKKYVQPATAEQIATIKRAEQFAAKGRKLDEFRVGDKVNCSEIPFDNGYYMGDLKIERFVGKQFVAESETSFYPFDLDEINKVTLIQTAEELQEVETNEGI